MCRVLWETRATSLTPTPPQPLPRRTPRLGKLSTLPRPARPVGGRVMVQTTYLAHNSLSDLLEASIALIPVKSLMGNSCNIAA